MRRRLIVVDDDELARHLVEKIAQQSDFDTIACSNREDLMHALPGFDPDVVVLDLDLGSESAVDVLEQLAEKGCGASILLASGFDTRVLSSTVRIGESLGLPMLEPQQKPVRASAMMKILGGVPARPQTLGEEDLAQAIQHSELVLEFQPKIDLTNGRPVGAEALIRWNHPTMGRIPPNRFVPMAELTAQIMPMTEFVISEALNTCRMLHETGHEIGIAVNISPACLARPDFAESVIGIVREAHCPPAYITLEVTETAAINDIPSMVAVLTRLRIAGFNLSLDDFGTGYSSLVELHRMPFSELKIDQAFVTDMAKDTEAATITKATIGMAHLLGLMVVAEGVEDEETLEILSACECDIAQGFHIARPMPADQLVDWLDERSLVRRPTLVETVA